MALPSLIQVMKVLFALVAATFIAGCQPTVAKLRQDPPSIVGSWDVDMVPSPEVWTFARLISFERHSTSTSKTDIEESGTYRIEGGKVVIDIAQSNVGKLMYPNTQTMTVKWLDANHFQGDLTSNFEKEPKTHYHLAFARRSR